MLRLPRFFLSPRLVVSLAVSGALAGCGERIETQPVSLEALASRTLTYALVDSDDLEQPDAVGSHRFTVTFSQPEDGCTRLVEGVTATLNGEPLHLEPGGVPDTAGGREVCEDTRAWFDFDPEVWAAEPVEDLRVLLEEEGGATVSLVLQGAKAKRRFAYQGTGSGTTLRRGQTYTYRWEPVTETPGQVSITLLREQGRAPATLAVTQEGGQASFTLPEATPLATHLLRLTASTPGEVLTCEGVAACRGALYHSSDYEVVVAP